MVSEADPRESSRRRFLAAAGTAALLPIAGCLGETPLSSNPVSLGWPTERIEMDGREKHLRFAPNGQDQATVTIRQETTPSGNATRDAERIAFFALVHHRDGLRTDSVTLSLRAPPVDGSSFFAAVYVAAPPTSLWPSSTVKRADEGWTVVRSGDIGAPDEPTGYAPGDANVRVEFLVDPTSTHPVEELEVGVDATLSEDRTVGRRRYRARAETTFRIVRS